MYDYRVEKEPKENQLNAALKKGFEQAALPAVAFMAGAAKLLHDHVPQGVLDDLATATKAAKIGELQEQLAHISG